MDRKTQIKEATNKYLESMPSSSRVTIVDLSYHVTNQVGGKCPQDYDWIRETVQSHPDFMIIRGRGICKR